MGEAEAASILLAGMNRAYCFDCHQSFVPDDPNAVPHKPWSCHPTDTCARNDDRIRPCPVCHFTRTLLPGWAHAPGAVFALMDHVFEVDALPSSTNGGTRGNAHVWDYIRARVLDAAPACTDHDDCVACPPLGFACRRSRLIAPIGAWERRSRTRFIPWRDEPAVFRFSADDLEEGRAVYLGWNRRESAIARLYMEGYERTGRPEDGPSPPAGVG